MVVLVEDLRERVIISKVHIYIYISYINIYVLNKVRLKIRLKSPVDQLDWRLPSSFHYD